MVVTEETGTVQLAVPRLTGTPGDDLAAWGLAMLLDAVGKAGVTLRDAGDHFAIKAPLSWDELRASCADAELPDTLSVPWLASVEKGKRPPDRVRVVRERDAMRDEAKRLAEAQRAGATAPKGGDAPAVLAVVPGTAIYALFRVLTSPGTQWTGYNSFAGLVQDKLASPRALELMLRRYDPSQQMDDEALDSALKALGCRSGGERWRNPPGFLYPGLNKGPTMRLKTATGSIGGGSEPDWTLADRGDCDVIRLYLTYVGYFAVAQVFDSDDGRAVVVPSPAEVHLPQILDVLARIRTSYSALEEYLLATTALSYAQGALRYWEEFVGPGSRREVLTGVQVALFWKPNANTFAPRRQAVAPLPTWLGRLREQAGYTGAAETLELHRRRLQNLRGRPRDEKKLPSEVRDAISLYLVSLAGGSREWLEAVAARFPAIRAAGDKRRIALWTTEEIRRVLMATDAGEEIGKIVEDERFQRVASAIRRATVHAHYARLERKRTGGGSAAFDPDYDLVARLGEAANRHPAEFLRGLYDFAARYNDETMRRNEGAEAKGQSRRPMLLEEDLRRVTDWVLEDRRGLVAAALLAFGTSRAPKTQETREAEQEGVPVEALVNIEDGETGDDERVEE